MWLLLNVLWANIGPLYITEANEVGCHQGPPPCCSSDSLGEWFNDKRSSSIYLFICTHLRSLGSCVSRFLFSSHNINGFIIDMCALYNNLWCWLHSLQIGRLKTVSLEITCEFLETVTLLPQWRSCALHTGADLLSRWNTGDWSLSRPRAVVGQLIQHTSC